MFIDFICCILLGLAIIKGISKGFIVAVFSLVAFVIGLAAAVKLSTVVAVHIQSNMNITGYWLPFLSFAIVFISVVFLVRIGASVLKKAAGFALLGWADTLAGIILYAAVYLMILSVVLYYTAAMGLLLNDTKNTSLTFKWIEPLGPVVIKGIGRFIPLFANMFAELNHFFEGLAKKA